jgi:hypothetical protein
VIPTTFWPLSYRLIGDNPAFAREFSALLTSCGFVQAFDGARITIVLLPPGEVAASPLQTEPIVEWRGLCVRRNAEQVSFCYRLWEMVLDLSTMTFTCSGPDPEAGERINFREFFLLSGLLFLMHRLGYFELHAAACAYEDSGYLLLGASGSGKTTAMLSLIASGWSYLSDDAMVVSAEGEGRISAHALRRSFSLKPDHLERRPELAACATECVPGTNKRRLDPRQVWPEQYAPVANPKFIIACNVVDDETTRLTPISRAEALARLVGSTPWLMFDRATAPTHLEVFRSLAASCRSFKLSAGRELFRNGELVASLIAPENLLEEWSSTCKEDRWG